LSSDGSPGEREGVTAPHEGESELAKAVLKTRSVRLTAFGDHEGDATCPHQASVCVVVVAAVREEQVGPIPWPADDAADGGDLVEQGQQLRDVRGGY
jgi:hypothetical protein